MPSAQFRNLLSQDPLTIQTTPSRLAPKRFLLLALCVPSFPPTCRYLRHPLHNPISLLVKTTENAKSCISPTLRQISQREIEHAHHHFPSIADTPLPLSTQRNKQNSTMHTPHNDLYGRQSTTVTHSCTGNPLHHYSPPCFRLPFGQSP